MSAIASMLTAEPGIENAAGKYLSFKLAEESFGISILKIQEIVGLMPVTFVPRTPAFMRGVINLRGKVIPVIDLRLKFGMESGQDTERTCIVVVRMPATHGEVVLGLIVDEVSEVLNIGASQIEPPPSMNAGDSEFILGMGKLGDKVIMLLDIDKAISADHLSIPED